MKRFILIFCVCFIFSINFIGCGKKGDTNTLTQNNVNVQNTNNEKKSDSSTTNIKDNSAAQIITNPKDLFSYLDLTRDQIIKQLGSNYKEEIDSSEGGGGKVFYYKEIGIRIEFFNPAYSGTDGNKVCGIDCDNKVSINGAATGMNFNEIMQKLGNAKITHIPYGEGSDYYEIKYRMDNVAIQFVSDKNDGSGALLSISKNEACIAEIEVEKALGMTDIDKFASFSWDQKQINGKIYYPVRIINVVNGLGDTGDGEQYYVSLNDYKVFKMDKKSGNLVLLSKN